jgi:hypothetical protein
LLKSPGLKASLAVSDQPFKGERGLPFGNESGPRTIDQRKYLAAARRIENDMHDD